MRMTLRNLLRLLDGAKLKPVDRQQLQQMVASSKRAQDLTERVQKAQSLRADRQKAYASPIVAAQRVAEYLDLRMSEAQIDEFELEVLASEPLFAEIAICSRLISSNPPGVEWQVPLATRELVYTIAQEALTAVIQERAAHDLPFVDGPEDEVSGSSPDAENALVDSSFPTVRVGS